MQVSLISFVFSFLSFYSFNPLACITANERNSWGDIDIPVIIDYHVMKANTN